MASKKYDMDGFKLFEKENTLRVLQSTVPPISNPAWATVYSGLTPKEHGLIDFTSINKNYERKLADYNTDELPPFWDLLAKTGHKSLVMTPVMVLEESLSPNVDMITGFPTPPRFSSKEVEVASKKFGFDGEPEIGNGLSTGKLSIEEGSRAYLDATKKRAELSKYLIDKNNYDLVFVCFSETDRIMHYTLTLGNLEGLIAPIFEEISKFLIYLDERIKRLEEEAVFILMSDHGASATHYKFIQNSWLINNGYATLKESVNTTPVASNKDSISTKIKSKVVDAVVENKYRRVIYSKLPRSLQKIGEGFIEESQNLEIQGKYIRISESDLDMPKTRAFSSVSTGSTGMIWINDSRFSNPCVKSDEKEPLINEIIEKLGKESFIERAYKGSDYYVDSEKLIAPDIIFDLKEDYTSDFTGYLKDKFIVEPEISRRGDHTKEGIFGIKYYNAPKIPGKIELKDIYPMVLKYFGVKDTK
jgi:predicted AlkP superfamily phosphohydrolase/phosphomutase